MIKPFIFQLPNSKIELVNESNIAYSVSNIIAQPLFKYGFHYYINQSKDKLIKLNNDDLKGKTFFNVIEKFDDNIPNYDKTISKINKKEIGIDIDRHKLELWEILSLFGLAGSVYINDEDYDPLLKAFYDKTGLKYKALTDFKGSDVYININTPEADIKQMEQAHFNSFIESIIEISDGLNKDGDCVIKIYDTYTEVSVKLLKLVSEMFEETYVYKPYLSYGRENVKYLVGLKYKKNFKQSNKLSSILKELKTEKLNNIFNDNQIPKDFEFVIKYMNIELGNHEHKMINILIDYINKSNYFGEVYHNSVDIQKKNSELWVEYFYSSNYKKTKDDLNSLIKKTIKENNDEMIKMFNLVI